MQHASNTRISDVLNAEVSKLSYIDPESLVMFVQRCFVRSDKDAVRRRDSNGDVLQILKVNNLEMCSLSALLNWTSPLKHVTYTAGIRRVPRDRLLWTPMHAALASM